MKKYRNNKGNLKPHFKIFIPDEKARGVFDSRRKKHKKTKQKYSQVRVEKVPPPTLRYLPLMKNQKVFMTDGEKHNKQSSKSVKSSSTDFKIFMADKKRSL